MGVAHKAKASSVRAELLGRAWSQVPIPNDADPYMKRPKPLPGSGFMGEARTVVFAIRNRAYSFMPMATLG